MGNTTSSLSSPQQNRLSKPRTNTSSNLRGAAASRGEPPSSPLSLSTRDSWISGDVMVVSASDEKPSRDQLRSKIRSRLFGMEDNAAGVDVVGEGSIQRRSSKDTVLGTTGQVLQLDPASPLSLTPQSSSVILRASVVYAIDPTTGAINPIQENDSLEERSASKACNPPKDAATDMNALLSPIRRRSFMTPGLATRGPAADNLRKPMPQQRRQSHIETGNDSLSAPRQASGLFALDLASDSHKQAASRNITPCDLDFSQLGALKLNTLRITNGTSSPAPSIFDHESTVLPASEAASTPNPFSNSLVPNSPHVVIDGVVDDRPTTRASTKTLPEDPTTGMSLDLDAEIQEVVSLFATSKATAFDDDLFEDEGISMSSRPNSASSKVSSTYASSTGRAPVDIRRRSLRIVTGSSEPSSPQDAIPPTYRISPRRVGDDNYLSNVDSGYDSDVSNQSLRKKQAEDPDKENLEISDAALHLTSDDDSQIILSRHSQSHVPVDQGLLRGEKGIALPSTETEASRGIEQEQKSWDSLDSGQVADSQAKPAHRKLKKQQRHLRPTSSRPRLISVQSCQDINRSSVPTIPTTVATKHADRLGRCRTLEHLEHTVPDLDCRISQENLAAETKFVPIQFPSPTTEPQPQARRRKSFIGRITFGKMFRTPEEKNATAVEPVSVIQRTRNLSLTDFGSVAQSLGESPYDIAMSASESQFDIHRTEHDSIVHPHQISTTMPRSKTMVGMDETAASEYAQAKSQRWSQSRSRSFSRPRSSHSASFDDRDGVPGRSRRPVSMFADAPPVPALPSPDQLKEKADAAARKAETTKLAPASPIRQAQSHPMVLCQGKGQELQKRAGVPRPQSMDMKLLRSYKERAANVAELDGTPVRARERFHHQSMRAHAPSHPSTLSPEGLARRSARRAEIPEQGRRNRETLDKTDQVCETPGVVFGRFEGGLGYGFESGLGVGGSAGMRNLRSKASRKSVPYSVGYGLDLSDVPVIVRCEQ
ncbi:MAG: hypothetical protein M1819_002223 [Sarea resinae]|nr:MAG: hypothetical protein M1819_002223 [Sarea resinae]